MLILGAGGHAKEVLDILLESIKKSDITFFDEIGEKRKIKDSFQVINQFEKAIEFLSGTPDLCIATGNPFLREKLYHQFEQNGDIKSVISQSAVISRYSLLEEGINIMHHVFVSTDVHIKRGVLVNAGAKIHHDVLIGEFSEIGPGALILGQCKLYKNVFIGAGAILLPKVSIGEGSIIGAGSVVTKDVPKNEIWKGIPASFYKKR